jgi:hypothetical protein
MLIKIFMGVITKSMTWCGMCSEVIVMVDACYDSKGFADPFYA